MEQPPPSPQAILFWLANYTHFICDQFSLPHEQGNGLLQQYLDLTRGAPSQQPAPSAYEQLTSYPDIPSPHQSHEQLPSAHLAAHLQDTPFGYPAPPNPQHEPYVGENADNMSNTTAETAANAAPWGPIPPYDQQSGDMMTVCSDFLEDSTSSPVLTEPPHKTPIGSLTDYDPLWVQQNNIDPAMVEKFPSRMKFDTLFTQDVIKMGDILSFQVSVCANGQDVATEAHLKVKPYLLPAGHLSCLSNQIIGISRHPRRQRFPDLSVTLFDDPSRRYPTLNACNGTTVMIEHLQTACNMTVLKSAWQDIQVFRGPQALGNLWWVKQAFHLWRDSKDQEAQETGQRFRQRRTSRAKGISGGVVHHNGKFGVWKFVPDPDQGRHRPRG